MHRACTTTHDSIILYDPIHFMYVESLSAFNMSLSSVPATHVQ